MERPDLEALLQGALDNTLTLEERDTLRRLMAESAEVRGRAAHLEQLVELLESLPPADAPPRLVHDVLSQISSSTRPVPVLQFARPKIVPKRGVTVNKTMMFGLAAAAACILAVITYTSNPPATEGTEATIGAAQRAQQPQIAPSDVKLGDQSAQQILQTDTWDAIMKDEDLRSMLEDAELRRALENDAIRRGLQDPELLRRVKAHLSSAKKGALTEAEARSISNANVRAALTNEAFAKALLNRRFAEELLSGRASRALSGEAMARLLRDAKVEQALRARQFGNAAARQQ